METKAPATPESIDRKAQRAELEAVLDSEHFKRAPMLSQLLSYLCEQLFAGQANQIKEYSVGVEVFHRGDAFDQNADSIVRVEANRLRKRLADYYAGPGASDQLRITIPLGQYVPDFCSVPPPATALAVGPAAAGKKPFSFTLPRLRIWLFPALLVLLAAGLAVALTFLWQKRQSAPAVSLRSPTLPTESQFGPPQGEEIRILAGATRSFVDHAGKLWNADLWFQGGTAVKSSVQNIWRTQEPGFYRTSRQGLFHYAIPLKKGVYELHLHFAETVYGLDSGATGGEGSRLMAVRANGQPLLNRFDVVADAGASQTADVKVFTGISPAADGLLHLDFSGQDGKQAILSAIEILPGFRSHIRPIRLLTRQTPYYSDDSRWWSPDSYFQGGQLASYSTPVKGTEDPELFETERWGNFTYAIPVTPGKYTVTLYFAARHGDWDQSASSPGEDKAPVAHIFDLFCNGNALLKNFDLAHETHQADVVVRKATGLQPNAQGKLLLSFMPVQGYATVTGIEIVAQ